MARYSEVAPSFEGLDCSLQIIHHLGCQWMRQLHSLNSKHESTHKSILIPYNHMKRLNERREDSLNQQC
jgi:hypothetical protein